MRCAICRNAFIGFPVTDESRSPRTGSQLSYFTSGAVLRERNGSLLELFCCKHLIKDTLQSALQPNDLHL